MFAELLNRLLMHSKQTPMLLDDVQILNARKTGENRPILHIFATNTQVSEHNVKQLSASCPDYVTIHVQDFNRKGCRMRLMQGDRKVVSETSLPEISPLGHISHPVH